MTPRSHSSLGRDTNATPSKRPMRVPARQLLAHSCWRQNSIWLVIGSFWLQRQHPATDSIRLALQSDKELGNLMLLLRNGLVNWSICGNNVLHVSSFTGPTGGTRPAQHMGSLLICPAKETLYCQLTSLLKKKNLKKFLTTACMKASGGEPGHFQN